MYEENREQEADDRLEGAFSAAKTGSLMAAGAALGVGLIAAMPPAAEPTMVDAPAKACMGEVVSGASDGMRDKGWSNPKIEKRIDILQEELLAFGDGVFRPGYQRGYEQAIAGDWSETALVGYLDLMEIPMSGIAEAYPASGGIPDDTAGPGFFAHEGGRALTLTHLLADGGDAHATIVATERSGLMAQTPRAMHDRAFGHGGGDWVADADAAPDPFNSMSARAVPAPDPFDDMRQSFEPRSLSDADPEDEDPAGFHL